MRNVFRSSIVDAVDYCLVMRCLCVVSASDEQPAPPPGVEGAADVGKFPAAVDGSAVLHQLIPFFRWRSR